MKKTIFISHSNPEDNYFASWLASKLKQIGYIVWIDTKNLLVGDSFWPEIERVLREESIKFIAIVSSAYISKARTKGSGIRKEISCATAIKDISNFIIPVRLDNSDYKQFSIDLLELDAIDFHSNGWKAGLTALLEDLSEMKTPVSNEKTDVLQFWQDSLQIASCPIAKPEKYLTNWFEIFLPKYLYVHQPNVLNEAELALMPFPYTRVLDRIITFASDKTVGKYTALNSTDGFSSDDFRQRGDLKLGNDFVIKKPNRKLVELLNKSLRDYFVNRDLKIYGQANEKEVFHFPNKTDHLKRISLKKFNKSSRVVIGKTRKFIWYLAISHSAALYPTPIYKIYYHLVFTDGGGNYLASDDQHELRRSLPNSWFNRKWMETLLAMIYKVSGFAQDNYLYMKVDEGVDLKMNVLPIDLFSSIGYFEPKNEQEPIIS